MSKPDSTNGYGGVFPTGRLVHLVRAASTTANAADAWRQYLALLGDARADEGERRLYPMVGANLRGAELSPAELAPLRAQRRAAAVRQEILFTAAAEIDDLLKPVGVAATLQKGLALQVRVYREQAVRASSDIDIFVRPADLSVCLGAVEDAGWIRTELRPRTRDVAAIASSQTRLTFRMPSGVEVDIHWSPRQVLEFDSRATACFIAQAKERDYRGRSWRIPSDSWLLFETIEHGMAWNRVTPVRWVTDALALLELEDAAIDWDQLIALVERARLNLAFATAFEQLRCYTDRIPRAVIARLSSRRTGSREKIYTRCLLRPPPAPWFGLLLSGSHVLLRGNGSPLRRVAAWPAYYRASALKCLSWSDVAARAAEKFGRRA